jgi:ubiquinone/menaquinone biosynthesis C-methylase UbiE
MSGTNKPATGLSGRGRGDYRCASATKLPVENASCDLVIAFMTLQDIDELTAAISEMGRILVTAALPASRLFIH